MPEANNGNGKQAAAGPATPAPAAPPAPTTAVEKKDRLSVLLEWSKPYRDIIGILAAVIVAVSGGVAWTVAHFATQAQLHYLECRVTNSISNRLLPIHMEEFAGKIEWRLAEAKVLAQYGGGTPASINSIVELNDQASALTKQQKDEVAKLEKEIDDLAKKCISETPQVGNTQ